MKLHVIDEFSPLKKVAVCWGYSIPEFESYETDDPQELKWGWEKWDKQLLLKQQDLFFSKLQKYGIELVELETEPELFWQMYTRDTGFVVGDTLYYAAKRTLKVRNGEIEKLIKAVSPDQEKLVALPGKIEGGDVLAGETTLIGISNRTNGVALDALAASINVKPLFLGDDVMHLDTRMTVLPNKYVLAYPEVFSENDWNYIKQLFKTIPITKEETKELGSNVFVINPNTIFVETKQQRIQQELKDAGFNVEIVPYSEPIILGGSFRCTTLPLVRE